MNIRAEDISRILREQVGGYTVDVDVAEVGTCLLYTSDAADE